MLSRCYNFQTLKNVINFKHTRLKSSNESLKEKTKLSREILKHHSEILCKLLDCNVHTASEIISKASKIGEFNHHKFYQNAKFCKNYLKLSDVIEYPSLLTLQPSLLQHRYFSLKELGFCNVTPSYIFRFSYIIKKTPQELKEEGFSLSCEHKSNILVEYLNASKRTEINDKLQLMYKDGSDFQKIKEVMNAEFLAAKLECSIGTAHEMLYKHAALRVQSILYTDQLLNILRYKLGFSISKICKSLSVLTVHPETVEHFLSEFPEILGVDTLVLVRRLPHLLNKENDFIHKIQAVLKHFNISNDQLISCPKVLLFAPSTLQKRLTVLCNTEDFAVLKSNKKFLWLVYYYKNLNSRVNCLKSENLPCSINMFITSKFTFQKYLLYNDTRKGMKETFTYLAEVFKMSEKEISDRLQHCSDIEIEDRNCSTINCRRVIEFLLMSGVTKKQIVNGLEIVYFDIDIVKVNFNRLKYHHLCQPYEEWISHYNVIHLLIYMIEITKNHSYDAESDEHEEQYLEMSSNYRV